MTENTTPVETPELTVVDEPTPSKKFQNFKKYLVISAAAVAATLIAGYVLSKKNDSEDDEDESTESTMETVPFTFTIETPTAE